MARCQHPSCRCPATDESDYCSASCARAAIGAIPPTACDCGHADCQSGVESGVASD